MGITKAVRFDGTTTVAEAFQHIADKCSLSVSTEELMEGYALFVPPKDTGPGKYLSSRTDARLLDCTTFENRDEVQLRRIAPSLLVLNTEGQETYQAKVDLEQTAGDFAHSLCKLYDLNPSHHELCVQDASAADDFDSPKHKPLEASPLLRDQGVDKSSVLMLRSTRRRKKKKQPTDISEPIFVKHSGRTDSEHTISRNAIFGQPIKKALTASTPDHPILVAPLILCAIRFVFENAMDVTGIFRISAKSNQVDELKKKYDDYQVPIEFDPEDDPHLVCSILKQYLRDLPEPVVPYRFYHDCLDIYEAHEENVEGIRDDLMKLLPQLPPENLKLLGVLCVFLKRVAEHEEMNKMGVRNLATVFGPNFLRLPAAGEYIQAMMRNAPRLATLTSTLITYADEIFGIPPELESLMENQKEVKKMKKLAVIGYVKAQHDYTPPPGTHCEITLSEDDLVVVFAQQDSGWWVGCVHGTNQAGFFPSNYCTEMVHSLIEAKRLGEQEQEVLGEPDADSTPMEKELKRLRRKLEKQKRLTKLEADRRAELETYTLEQLERISTALIPSSPSL